MKRNIFLILCATLMLHALADTPRLSRAQLQQAAISKSRPVSPSSSADGQGKPVTLQQLLKERNLTLNDNKLMTKAPRHLTDDELVGIRIASMDVYDFEWNEETGIATVIDSTCALAGQKCEISLGNQGEILVTGLFDLEGVEDLHESFTIPFDYNSNTGVLKINAGIALDTIGYVDEGGGPMSFNFFPQQITFTLYVMPLSWLTGDDDYDNIHAHVYDDGSMVFDDDFAFLVKRVRTSQRDVTTTWSLSPIYKNLTLFMPNGLQYFTSNIVIGFENFVLGPEGNGGFTPRPINPRPSNTKPVKPRSFSAVIDGGKNGNGGRDGNVNEPRLSPEDNRGVSSNRGGSQSEGGLPTVIDIYAYMLDDTTVMVYNLFDLDYCWNYMYVNADGSVHFPDQPIHYSNTGNELYNCSKDPQSNKLHWGNHGFSVPLMDSGYYIWWDDVYMCTEDSKVEGRYFTKNKLIFGSSLLPAPEFAEPVVSDSAVVFSATGTPLDEEGVLMLFAYNEDTAEFELVDNPWIAPRGNEPYWVYLIAEYYYEEIGRFSEEAYLYYEVPALGSDGTAKRGDVNRDGFVTISE